jgi:hypothetical protein
LSVASSTQSALARAAQRQLRSQQQLVLRLRPRRRGGQARHFLQLGDERQAVLGQRRRQQQRARRARHAARHHQPPRLPVTVRVAQRDEGQPDLDAVAVGQARGGGVDIEVGREVLAVAGGDVQAVGHDAGGVDAHELRRAAVADGVDHHGDEILVALDLVAPRQRCADLVGSRVPGAHADHERIVLGQHLQRGAVAGRRRLAIDRQELHEALVQRRALPRRLVEPSVEGDALARLEFDRTRLLRQRGGGQEEDQRCGSDAAQERPDRMHGGFPKRCSACGPATPCQRQGTARGTGCVDGGTQPLTEGVLLRHENLLAARARALGRRAL